jgi:hypothetical protein
MTKSEFQSRLKSLLNETLEDGPGPRAVVALITDALMRFICNEAGADAPAATEEAIEWMREVIARQAELA